MLSKECGKCVTDNRDTLEMIEDECMGQRGSGVYTGARGSGGHGSSEYGSGEYGSGEGGSGSFEGSGSGSGYEGYGSGSGGDGDGDGGSGGGQEGYASGKSGPGKQVYNSGEEGPGRQGYGTGEAGPGEEGYGSGSGGGKGSGSSEGPPCLPSDRPTLEAIRTLRNAPPLAMAKVASNAIAHGSCHGAVAEYHKHRLAIGYQAGVCGILSIASGWSMAYRRWPMVDGR